MSDPLKTGPFPIKRRVDYHMIQLWRGEGRKRLDLKGCGSEILSSCDTPRRADQGVGLKPEALSMVQSELAARQYLFQF